MIIAIANEQGGADKSILAQNLAALRARAGHKVLLIDADPRRSSLMWSNERGTAGIKPNVPARAICGKSLQPELENVRLRYNDIVIDTEARDCLGSRSALVAARVAIIPIVSNWIDPTAQAQLVKRMEIARLFNPGLRVIIAVTCELESLSAEDIAAVQALIAKIPAATLADPVIHKTLSMHRTSIQGMSVAEYHPADAQATAEMASLYRQVFEA